MKTLNEEQKSLLKQLVQLGYEEEMMPSTIIPQLQEIYDLTEGLENHIIEDEINYCRTEKGQEMNGQDYYTLFRFSVTAGIGATYIFMKDKERLATMSLYDIMIEERGFFAMDEWIEDYCGIFWKSDEHRDYRVHFIDVFNLVNKNYDFEGKDKDKILLIVDTLLYYGLVVGAGRYNRETLVKPCSKENQCHGEHIEALLTNECFKLDNDKFDELINTVVDNGKNSLTSIAFIGHDNTKPREKRYVEAVTYSPEGKGLVSLYSKIPGEDSWKLISMFPRVCSGNKLCVELDEVEEWDNGLEAILTVHTISDDPHELRFFDTRYYENKKQYMRGAQYLFDIAGLALTTNIIDDEKLSFTFEGEKAIRFREKLGEEQKYDEQGNPEPINFDLHNLFKFIGADKKYSDIVEYQFPIANEPLETYMLDNPAYRLTTNLNGFDGDKSTEITVFAAKSLFKAEPQKDDAVSGLLWLQGYMCDMVRVNDFSSKVHTFYPTDEDDNILEFTHNCEEEDKVKEMTDEEYKEFIHDVFQSVIGEDYSYRVNKTEDNMADFICNRNRAFWIIPERTDNPNRNVMEDVDTNYANLLYYGQGKLPVAAYISLENVDQDNSAIVKGGTYKARFNYVSIIPNQKNKILPYYSDHNELLELVYKSFSSFSLNNLPLFLDKDIEYKSHVLPDIIISVPEFVTNMERVFRNNIKLEEERSTMEIIENGDDNYIVIHYPDYPDSILRITTEDGRIVSINITPSDME